MSGAYATPSPPPLSEFDYPPDDPFPPGFGDPDASGAAAPDPEAPVPPPLSDSARAEFFAAPSSPHQPVFLTWFERVLSTLAETNSRIVNLLASGRPESSILHPRQAQYSVGGGASLGSAALVNPF